MVQVREKSRFGPCYALGELIGETASRYIYRNRAGTAFVSKSSSIHLAPCQVRLDYQQSDEAAFQRRRFTGATRLQAPDGGRLATSRW